MPSHLEEKSDRRGPILAEVDFTQFKISEKGNKFEDFSKGQEFQHHWGRTITSGENGLFASTILAYTPIYTNDDYAKRHGYTGMVTHPLLVLCTVVGMSVEDLSEAGGPFLGVNDVNFHQPVYPGDTLYAKSTVLSVRESASRPTHGIVTWKTQGRNQNDLLVIDYERTNLVSKRGSEAL
ncbi:MaoC family dehydratase [Myxococcota bacterium]|nr:MaoC family dehydratase [Myxococcota bacterium]